MRCVSVYEENEGEVQGVLRLNPRQMCIKIQWYGPTIRL